MSKILDLDTLNTLKDVIGDDLKEIIHSFLDLIPSQLDSIESSARKNDTASLRLHSHTLKGSASNVGAEALSDISYRIEDLAKSGNMSGALNLMSELRTTADRTGDALRKFMV